jgi:CHAT domain-containing protein
MGFASFLSLCAGQAATAQAPSDAGFTTTSSDRYRACLSFQPRSRGLAEAPNCLRADPVGAFASPRRTQDRGGAPSLDRGDVFSALEFKRYESALQVLEQKIRLLEAGGPEQLREAAAAWDLKGIVRQRQSRYLEALTCHDRAIELYTQQGIRGRDLVAALNNRAVASYFLGRLSSSEADLGSIIGDAAAEPVSRSRAFNNRALIEIDTGREDAALIDLTEAESAARSQAARVLLAEVLNNEARIYRDKRNRVRAEELLSEALPIALAEKAYDLKATILDSWGELLLAFDDPTAALVKLDAAGGEEQALPALVKASVLKNRGTALGRLGRYEAAGQAFDEALAGIPLDAPGARRDILAARSRVRAAHGDVDGALKDLKVAIRSAEESREHLSGESESGFVRACAEMYREAITLLMQRRHAGDVEQALVYFDRAGAAELQAQMVDEVPRLRDAVAVQDIEGARGVLRQEAALVRALQAELDSVTPDRDRMARLRALVQKVRQQAAAAIVELDRQQEGRYSYFIPAAVDPRLFGDLRRQLPARTLLVSFTYGDQGLYAFLVSREHGIEFRQNPSLTRQALEAKIAEYRDLVTRGPSRREDWRIDSWKTARWAPLRDATAWLYQQILAPINDRLEDADNLIFAPTGELYYLPLHALGEYDAANDTLTFIATQKQISYVAPGSLLKLAPSADGTATLPVSVLAFGAVDYRGSLAELPYSRKEIAAVEQIFGSAATALEGPRATKAQLLKALARDGEPLSASSDELSKFRVVLLSTHGVLDANNPSRSYLAMEGGTHLAATEVSALPLRGTDLVALSACDTALATQHPGAELMSLGEHVALAGAASTLVTLWSVDDLETSHWMRIFFERLHADPASRAAAVQSAQLALIADPASRHPFFWAPFVLYGRP